MNAKKEAEYRAAISRMLQSERENQVRTIVIEGGRSGHPVYVIGLMKSGREIPIAQIERSTDRKWIWSGLEDSSWAGRGESGLKTLGAAFDEIQILAFQDAGWMSDDRRAE